MGRCFRERRPTEKTRKSGCCFEGSHRFGADMELECCSKEQRRLEEGGGESYDPKMGPSAIEDEVGLDHIELF